MKKDYQKALKKLTLFFLLNPVPLNGQSYQKQKGPGTSEQLLLRLQNKFKKIPSLVIYYILHLQIYTSQFMTSKIIPLIFILLNLESVGRKGENYKNLNILRKKRAF